MERKTLCLLGAVLVGVCTAGAGHAAASEEAPAPPATATMQEQNATGETVGKPGAGQAAADTPIPEAARQPLEQRLAARGMKVGNPVMIRIFKADAELELWMQAGDRFELLTTYPICNWSGTLGPKLTEGDKQSPEGLYSIGRRQLRHSARWHRSLDIGFPNAFDRSFKRTGSDILVHGGCTSTGCFAMTDPVIEEIFRLSQAALLHGQKRIQVHAFPFRMTAENMAAFPGSQWTGFWENLKEAYDVFERTRRPPSVRVCNQRYVVSESDDDDDRCPTQVSTASASAEMPAVRRLHARSALRAYAAARRARLATRDRHRHAQAAGRRSPR